MSRSVDSDTARLAWLTILQQPAIGIPTAFLHPMEHRHIERLAGVAPGEYRRDPERVYLACQRGFGTCLLDQFIPENPLTMGDRGYEGSEKGATQGAERVIVDHMLIDSPESVVEHLERVEFPRLRVAIAGFDEGCRVREILDTEDRFQDRLGSCILKTGYGFIQFPKFAYSTYGYAPYFMAYALYPDVIERHFSLQADLAVLNNRAAARAYQEGALPPLYRLDHDIADSRGTLTSPSSLDRMWMPHVARALEPMVHTSVRMIWHCDGNLMAMVPRLLEVGVRGFQGFQYEDGMDYPRICAMKDRWGDSLIIWAGVSVTRTLPFGTPADVRRELAWLVDHGPATGLFLSGSSSITPGVPWENIAMLVAGLRHYRTAGRGSRRS